MESYNKQYKRECDLFGDPYPEFEQFIKSYEIPAGAKALDVGCGQGRDSLMLAKYGYDVTGIDSSHVGIEQMRKRAKARQLSVTGVVGDLFEFDYSGKFSAIVLDSILHFQKSDLKKETELLNRLINHLEKDGLLIIFIHQSDKKEKVLNNWIKDKGAKLRPITSGYIDYLYEEKATNFKSSFQMYMSILQQTA